MMQQPKRGPVLESGPLARNWRLARLGLGLGAQLTAHTLRNAFRGEAQRATVNREFYRVQGQVLARELGRLKGSVMKAGQLLALYGGYFLPEEVIAELASLQELTQPLAWPHIAAELEAQLGARRLAELDIEQTPIGAASLGQVHRARRRSDGLELCLKIQYPGVAESVDSDMRTLSRLLIMSRLLPRDLDLTPMLAELRLMLRQETDYGRERGFIEDYGRRLAGDARFIVPRVYPEFCAPRVLAMSFEAGFDASDPAVQSQPLAQRNDLAAAFVDLFLTELFDWRVLQTDPNFGNYRFQPQPGGGLRIVLLDFGATRTFPAPFVSGYADIVLGALRHDRARIVRGATAIGLLDHEFPPDMLETWARMCEAIVEPFDHSAQAGTPSALLNAHGAYRWGASDLPARAAVVAARTTRAVTFRMPPPELLFLHRRLSGVFVMLAALHAELNAGAQVIRALEWMGERR